MTRRGRGEDSVYFEGDRWRGAVSLGYGPDGWRVWKKVSGATKAEVLRRMRELRAELDAGLPVPDDRLSVAAYLDRWITKSLPGQVSDRRSTATPTPSGCTWCRRSAARSSESSVWATLTSC